MIYIYVYKLCRMIAYICQKSKSKNILLMDVGKEKWRENYNRSNPAHIKRLSDLFIFWDLFCSFVLFASLLDPCFDCVSQWIDVTIFAQIYR